MKMTKNLTYLGLLPFIFLSLINLFKIDLFFINSEKALIFYSALILSFIGGIYFGISQNLEENKNKILIISVLPQIFAWLILIFLENFALIKLSLIFCFLALIIIETYYFSKFIDKDFLKMRCKATVIVILFLSLSIDNAIYKCT